MKALLTLFIFPVWFLSMAGCSKEKSEPEPIPEPIPEAELSVRNHSLSFDYAGQFLGYDTFEIESDAEWRIEAVDAESEQWIAFDKLQGKNSDRVRVRVPPPIPVR